jgi:uncharacterized RDD family membrane protein YckC
MVDREGVGGWLEGPGRRREPEEGEYAGSRLGLPESGAGSVATFGRRFGAVLIDWLACLLIARAFTSNPWLPLAIFTGESVVLISTLGSTFGMRLLGLRVVPLEAPRLLPPARVLLRTVLLVLVIPAFVWDRDGRGLHDRLAGSAVVRAR